MLSCTKHSGLTKQKQLALSRHKAAVPRYETHPTGAHPIDPNKANRSPINPTKAWCMAIGFDVLLAAHGSARTSSCASLSAGTLQRTSSCATLSAATLQRTSSCASLSAAALQRAQTCQLSASWCNVMLTYRHCLANGRHILGPRNNKGRHRKEYNLRLQPQHLKVVLALMRTVALCRSQAHACRLGTSTAKATLATHSAVALSAKAHTSAI
jgi:hypothetical protein